jgi:hypothetical protein
MREGTADKQWQGEALREMVRLEGTGKLPPLADSVTIDKNPARSMRMKMIDEMDSPGFEPDFGDINAFIKERQAFIDELPPLEPVGMLGQATADAMDPVDVYEPNNCEVEES